MVNVLFQRDPKRPSRRGRSQEGRQGDFQKKRRTLSKRTIYQAWNIIANAAGSSITMSVERTAFHPIAKHRLSRLICEWKMYIKRIGIMLGFLLAKNVSSNYDDFILCRGVLSAEETYSDNWIKSRSWKNATGIYGATSNYIRERHSPSLTSPCQGKSRGIVCNRGGRGC